MTGPRLAFGLALLVGCSDVTQDEYVFFAEDTLLPDTTHVALSVFDTEGNLVLPSEPRGLSANPDGRVATLVLAPEDNASDRGYSFEARLLSGSETISLIGPINDVYEEGVTRERVETFLDQRCPDCSDICVGARHTCVLRNRSVYCFGSNTSGQLGVVEGSERRPYDVGVRNVTALDCIRDSTCILDGSGQILCWGRIVGGADPASRNPGEYDSVHTSEGDACGLRDGGFVCDGENSFSRHGYVEPQSNRGPYLSVSYSHKSGCGILEDGSELRCWGSNGDGNLGTGDTGVRQTPSVTSLGTTPVRHVSVTMENACVVAADGRILCTGISQAGRLGDAVSEPMTDEFVEIRAEDPTLRFREVSIGGHGCAITWDQDLYCWGANGAGQLGLGDTVPRGRPTQVEGKWRLVRAGGGFTCALDLEDTLYCWGRNNYFQSGIPGAPGTDITSPQPVPGIPILAEPLQP